jgi:broad specificity phosphatase PhoE
MRHLVFVRHGESELNAISRHTRTYCGRIETPLTDKGREQARSAGRKLAELKYIEPKVAISSPLARARETLELLLAHLPTGIEVLVPAEGLLERSHGEFEGLTEEHVFREYPHYRDDPAYSQFMNHFEQCAPGGESLGSVMQRVWSAVETLTQSTTGDLIIVSHFNPIRCAVGKAMELAPEQVLKLHIPNAEPIVLGWNGKFSMVESPNLGGWEF